MMCTVNQRIDDVLHTISSDTDTARALLTVRETVTETALHALKKEYEEKNKEGYGLALEFTEEKLYELHSPYVPPVIDADIQLQRLLGSTADSILSEISKINDVEELMTIIALSQDINPFVQSIIEQKIKELTLIGQTVYQD